MFSVRRRATGRSADPSLDRALDTALDTAPDTTFDTAPESVPVGFEGVAGAALDGSDVIAASETVGRDLALDGRSADEALRGLRTTWRAVRGVDPPFEVVTAVVTAWSEATLAVVNDISCEDPMTGLASAAHLRSSLGALFSSQRHAGMHPRDSHALVLVELPGRRDAGPGSDAIVRAMRLTSLGEAARTVFPAGEVVGRVGAHRVAVLARRDARLGVRVRLLRRLLEGTAAEGQAPRVWIEGLPASDLAAGMLLDELARA